MNFLAINSGSSSLKAKMISMPDRQTILTIEIKNYNDLEYSLEYKSELYGSGKNSITNLEWENRSEILLGKIAEILPESVIDYYIHRIVHGGEKYDRPVLLTQDVIFDLKDRYNKMAPLHNPNSISIIEKIFQSNISSKQIGVFDTAWNLSIEPVNFLYALPAKYYRDYKVRRYGFHGISHKYVFNSLMEYKKNYSKKTDSNKKIISCHLGSGCSVCAIENAKVVDNSFGFSPMENIIMSTRVGEIDYDAVKFIQQEEKLSDSEISTLLTKKSGLLGISGYTKDMKKIIEDKDKIASAKLAIDLFVNSVVKEIGSLFITLGGVDIIIFTGGIGSGSDFIRAEIIKKLKVINCEINNNENNGKRDVDTILNITGERSNVEVWVVPTNEEIQMTVDSYEYINLALK